RLATRHTQTNEPGRAALLALGLPIGAGQIGTPIGLLDAGCSAGLNLLLDRYRFDFGAAGGLGPADSPVTIPCAPRRPVPAPGRPPGRGPLVPRGGGGRSGPGGGGPRSGGGPPGGSPPGTRKKPPGGGSLAGAPPREGSPVGPGRWSGPASTRRSSGRATWWP